MKIRVVYVAAAIVCVALAAPVFAQQPSAEAEYQFQGLMTRFPEARQNPSLLTNPSYLAQHPGLATFLQQHPGIENQVREGAFDNNRSWHDSNWWGKNNPNWVSQNRPEWFKSHPEWGNSGEADEKGQWHDRKWWVKNNRKWVQQHHPEWEHHDQGHEHHD